MPRVLSALLDTPSSPLAPPAGSNAGGTSPARSPSSTLPVTPSNRNRGSSSSPYNSAASNRHFRRQPSTATEDFTQVGVLHARKLKLKPEAVMMLEDFCKLATSASDVVMYAQMLKITDMQALVSPANIAFTISKQLDNKIDIHSMRTMLSPSLPFYVKKSGGDTPSGIMKTLILDHRTAWGVTPDVIDDKSKWGVITTRVRTRLTDRRYEIKKTISDSIWIIVKAEDGEPILTNREDPLDIIRLCEALVDMVPEAGLKVTLPLLGRVALLRHVLVEVRGGQKFWDRVDEEIVGIRKKYDNDETRISKAIGKVLKNDRRRYGNPDISIFG